VSAGFGVVVALAIRSMLAPHAVTLSNLDRASSRAIVQAVQRGEAVADPAYAELAAERAAAERRQRQVMLVGLPACFFVFKVLLLLHQGASFGESVLEWRGSMIVAMTIATSLLAWRGNRRLLRAEELNRELAARQKGSVG
jgi:hypothetical protein